MKDISTGAGLVVLGLGIALHPLVAGLVAQAIAAPVSPSSTAATGIVSASTAQAGPTIVWMGVTFDRWLNTHFYHRLWSDSRLEVRRLMIHQTSSGCAVIPAQCDSWVEVPPPPGGNGFACRTDINGDRRVDGADLSFLLDAWGHQGGCEPDAAYPCLDLGNLAGGVAAK